MTTGPSAGPSSAYPTFNTPASTCFNEVNVLLFDGTLAGFAVDCASAGLARMNGAAATPRAVAPRTWRRFLLICSDMFISSPKRKRGRHMRPAGLRVRFGRHEGEWPPGD